MFHTTEITNRQLQEARARHASQNAFQLHHDRIERDLRAAGAVRYDLLLPETNSLPLIIHAEEHICGAVYGRYKRADQLQTIRGRGLLIATNTRLLFIDKKPLFLRCHEISYDVSSGVSYSRVALAGTLTLNTRLGDISVRTFNHKSAQHFMHSIEDRLFRPQSPGQTGEFLALNKT